MALQVSLNQSLFLIFVHNKGQMYFPKLDNIFGSDFLILDIAEIIQKKNLNKTGLYQYLKLERIFWKSLDAPEKKCDRKNKGLTTKCITNYLEQSIGCSMGLAESNPAVER